MDETPNGQPQDPGTDPSWGTPNPNYPPPSAQYPPVQPVAEGLSDNMLGALAYVTIIPAIFFLVVAPYNQKPFIKFNAFQCLGLALVWFCIGFIFVIPVFGWIIGGIGNLAVIVCWLLCIIKASQGSVFKLPVIGDFAAQQSGYRV
ncbi:DUF4870 domain-containing protein [Granulicella mallensis]|uniref:Chloroplast import component protein (Tic20) n=1 Tax=Granulicella mallensis (strain ATCC BAA-1857 / DSM 23137 / MP5ACTX8) TaxID=682795 RepID=G8NVS9_GRAMM|nr:hypothetical protein [Granulicella mallensis]AEU38832.1 hypothetical protein AciX8_4561 [Granulicella mallensis MP5ACTX8]